MGFFGSMIEVVSEISESFFAAVERLVPKEIVERACEIVGKVVEAVKEGNWSEVVEQVTEVGATLVEQVVEIGGEVIESMAMTVSEVVDTIKEGVGLVLEEFQAHPRECIGIVASFALAVANFAAGNVAGGIQCLSSGFVKVGRLVDLADLEHPDSGVRDRYLLPEAVKENMESVVDVPSEELDEYFLRKAQEIDLEEG